MSRPDPASAIPAEKIHRPYPGLRSFGREEADRFFGREDQVDQLLDKLAETKFLAVLGTSGSGKSSLVRAGLLPALDSGVLIGAEAPDAITSPHWSVAEIRPGDRPIARLAAALIRDTGLGHDCTPLSPVGCGEQSEPHQSEEVRFVPHRTLRPGWGERSETHRSPDTKIQADCIAELEQDLRRGSRALNWRLGVRPLPAGERLLILVDQFEELFRYQRANAEEAAAFVALLLAASSHPDCYVAITLRSEYLGDCSRFRDLPEAINAGLFLTPRLSPEQLADAIELPARLPGFDGEVSPGLVRRLLEEATGEQDQLPLLQHLLMRLWDEALAAGNDKPVLDEADLDALGGLLAALDQHAEEAFAELDPNQQKTAEVLFRALTERSGGKQAGERDTRRPVSVAEVAGISGASPADVIACTRPFRRSDRSFLMPPADQNLGADTVIDITHEALIRQWSRLQEWTADEAEQAELYRRLESAAGRREQCTGALWIDPDLQIALDWRERHQPTAGWAARYGGDFGLAMRFLDAGCDQREAQHAAEEARRRKELHRAWLVAGISIAALAVTLALAGWAWIQQQHAIAAERRAEEQKTLALEAKQDAERAGQQRTEQLFESGLTHAALLAEGEDYAAAWRVLGQTVSLDEQIPIDRRHARNLLAGFVNLRRGGADLVYRGAGAALDDLALSPDGRWLVAGGERGTLVVFDAASGELVRRLEGHDPEAEPNGSVSAVRFTADGKTLITAGDDRRIIHWSVPDWQIQRQWQAPAEVWSLALSPDGETLASAGKVDGITLWSMATGERIRTLTGESSTIANGTALAWLPDGRLVSGGYNGQVGIWNPETGKEQVLPKLHADQVNSVAVSPGGKRLATGSSDKSIVLWDFEKGTARPLRGHKNRVPGLAFDRTGQSLFSAGFDNDLRLWDVESGTTLRVFQGYEAGLWSVVARNGQAYTAANDGTLRRWPLDKPGQWIWDLDGLEPTAAQLLLDEASSGTGGLLVGFDDGVVRAYALPSDGERSARLAPSGPEPTATTAPEAVPKVVSNESDAHGPHSGPYPVPVGSAVRTVPPIPSGPWELTKVEAHNAVVKRFALSPDGQTLATAGMDHTARLWHIRRDGDGLSLNPIHSFDQHASIVHAVAFSSDGRLLATAGYDGRVGLVDVESGEGALSRAAEQGWLMAVEFAPDGNSLVTTHFDERRLRLWQRNGLRLGLGRTIADLTDGPLWASLSPDGRRVATVGRGQIVSVYDLDRSAAPDPANAPASTGTADPLRLVGHEQTVLRAIFAPDGRQLATVSGDMTVRFWDLGPEEAGAGAPGQALFNLRLPTEFKSPSPLWDFDFRCNKDQAGNATDCWIAVPLTIGRVALYHFPYANPPAGLRPE